MNWQAEQKNSLRLSNTQWPAEFPLKKQANLRQWRESNIKDGRHLFEKELGALFDTLVFPACPISEGDDCWHQSRLRLHARNNFWEPNLSYSMYVKNKCLIYLLIHTYGIQAAKGFSAACDGVADLFATSILKKQIYYYTVASENSSKRIHLYTKARTKIAHY